MGQIQVVQHVHQDISPAEDEDDRVPVCDDSVHLLGIRRHGGSVRLVFSILFLGGSKCTLETNRRMCMFLPDYVDQQSFVENLNHLAAVYNDDFVGVASYNIFVGIAVATIFGAAFFFDLFWPERYESPSVRLAWKISAVAVTVMCFGAAISMTVRLSVVATTVVHVY